MICYQLAGHRGVVRKTRAGESSVTSASTDMSVGNLFYHGIGRFVGVHSCFRESKSAWSRVCDLYIAIYFKNSKTSANTHPILLALTRLHTVPMDIFQP